VTATFHLLWMLCALGAITFAAAAAPRWRRLVALSAGFAGSLLLIRGGGPPDAEAAGLVAAASAVVFLFAPRYAWVAAMCGGGLAGTGVRLLLLVGAPATLAVAGMTLGVGATVWLVRRRTGFASELVREEALLIVCVLGVAVAILPGVLDGWRTAATLNVSPNVPLGPVPIWALSTVILAALVGAMHALWSRR